MKRSIHIIYISAISVLLLISIYALFQCLQLNFQPWFRVSLLSGSLFLELLLIYLLFPKTKERWILFSLMTFHFLLSLWILNDVNRIERHWIWFIFPFLFFGSFTFYVNVQTKKEKWQLPLKISLLVGLILPVLAYYFAWMEVMALVPFLWLANSLVLVVAPRG